MRKSRGFEGELIIEIPTVAITKSQKSPLIHSLFISRMGYYPNARHHYYKRPGGCSQVILLYCTDGKGWIQLKKNTVKMEAGNVYLIPAGTPHSYGADTQNPWTIYWFHFMGKQSGESVSAIAGSTKKERKSIHVRFSEERNTIFKKIAATLLKGYSASNLLFANFLLQYYLATFITPENFQLGNFPAQESNSTDKAILFMQDHLSQPVTLDNIAQSAHLSISFFSRKFKNDTGYAPIEYFNHLRIQRACQLLHFSTLRVNEVASQVGIDDPFYFSRLFKQQMGVSPVTYRKNEGGNLSNRQ
ncbi:MAG: AraC family transcriptional regulator [Chitinophagaceae bacterium]|nr:AraC family transcriptional regulator [Chitinophagaceae bacterium]